MLPPRALLALCLSLLAGAVACAEADVAARRLEGEIAGARWAALVPENWNGKILLEAPDRRPAGTPPVATLATDTPDHQALLGSGWALATTCYRRTGPVLADAAADLRALRTLLLDELGTPRQILVAGRGMGGVVAVLLAERHSDEFHALLALDPQFAIRDPRALRLKCDGQPRAPLLILFGSTARMEVIAYRDRARIAANAESFVPTLWFQPANDDDGPPITLAEAVEALSAWATTQQAPADRTDTMPALDDPPPASKEALPKTERHELPDLPDEPPPSVDIDDTPAEP